jgi:two-component system cell cycle sensor histidine kinase/response regulator CckA
MAGIFSISELYYSMMKKDDPMANGMGQIKKSALQAQKLVRRIIDLHRDKPATRSLHDLKTLLSDQMDLVGILIPPSAKIITKFSKEPMLAYIEETGFRQVILNLVINARDVIAKRGKIKITLRKVSRGDLLTENHRGKKTKVLKDGAEVIISDNGSGIQLDIADKIFDPFFTTKDSSAGSGFGLYNCKLFVEDHKGTIGFNSKPGKGTSFFFYLPLDPRREDQ